MYTFKRLAEAVRAKGVEMLSAVDEGGRKSLSALTSSLEYSVTAGNELAVLSLTAGTDIHRMRELSFTARVITVVTYSFDTAVYHIHKL
jgi:hypothetical protein